MVDYWDNGSTAIGFSLAPECKEQANLLMDLLIKYIDLLIMYVKIMLCNIISECNLFYKIIIIP